MPTAKKTANLAPVPADTLDAATRSLSLVPPAATPADEAALKLALSSYPWLRRAQIALLANRPFVLWGPPGVGKTELLTLLHRVMFPGKPFYTLILSGRDPSDVQGMAAIDHATGHVHLASWAWVEEFVAAKGGTLFLDELSTAAGATQAVGLRIMQERYVGERKLPAEVRICGAANPADCAVDGEPLKAPTANRLGHITVGKYGNAAQTKTTSKDLAPGWIGWISSTLVGSEAEREAATLVGGFIEANPEALFAFPHDDEGAQGYGWPSPRSWANFAAVFAAGIAAGPAARQEALFMSDEWLGEAVGKTFRVFARHTDLPKPRALLDGAAAFRFDAAHADKAIIVVTGVAGEAVRGPAANAAERAKLVDTAWRIVLDAVAAKCGDTVRNATKALQMWRIRESGAPLATTPAEAQAFRELGIDLNKLALMLR